MTAFIQNFIKSLQSLFNSIKNIVLESRESLKPQLKVRARIIVKGRIFEGSYHVFAEQQARDYSLKGWMKVRDGLSPSAFLEMEVEGTETKVKSYIMDLRRGNRDSSVALVTVEWKPVGTPPFTGFQRLL